jgi:integrase
MLEDVAAALAKLRNRDRFTSDTDLVFPDWTGGHQPHMELRARFYAALQAADLKRIRFHDLRHTFATWCASEGEALGDIQAWMGHAHQSTTDIYKHYQPHRDHAQRLTRKYRAVSEPPAGVPA